MRRLTKQIKEVEIGVLPRKKKSKTTKKGKKQVTAATLRSMEDVQEEVEKLMNKHLKQGMSKQGRKTKRNKSKCVISSSNSSSRESEKSSSEESNGSKCSFGSVDSYEGKSSKKN